MSVEYETAIARLYEGRGLLNDHNNLVAGAQLALDRANTVLEHAVAGREAVEGTIRSSSFIVRDAILEDYTHDITPSSFATAVERLCVLRGGVTVEDRRDIADGAQRAAETLMQNREEIVLVFGQFVTAHHAIPDSDGRSLTVVESDRSKFLDPVLTIDKNIDRLTEGVRGTTDEGVPVLPVQKGLSLEAFKHVATNAKDIDRIESSGVLRRFEKQAKVEAHPSALVIGREAIGSLLEHIAELPDYTDSVYSLENKVARIGEFVDLSGISAMSGVRERYVVRTLEGFIRTYFYHRHRDSWDFTSAGYDEIVTAQGYQLGSPELLELFYKALLTPEEVSTESIRYYSLGGVVIEPKKLKLALIQMDFPDKGLLKEMTGALKASGTYEN